ncbi:NAD(P)-binding protein [Candidatus Bathyarchaeota archaeon]|nr:NAD(P)-binding protein [Candidatus Bathyarchaeota archaeon]
MFIFQDALFHDMASFPLLFSPLKVGPVELQNRVVMPAMHLSYAEGGHVNSKLINFYSERATSEIGLIIIGGCYVNKYGMGIPSMIGIDDDEFIPGLHELTKAIHGCSKTMVGAQLYHSGRYSFKQIIGTQPVSASATFSKFSKQDSRELSVDEIQQHVQDFALAAARAKKAEFDVVEICGSAGYLIDQFMSPLTNKRDDEYGGSLENRLRFPIEVIQACRAELDDDTALIMRYSGSDLVPGSNDLEQKITMAPRLVKAGLDALNVTGGWHESRVPSITMGVPPGAFTYFSSEIRKQVNIPVFASNRINDPLIAESIIREGKADATCIGRGQICDPEFASKARKGNPSLIRKCIGCNQGCFDAIFNMSPVSCLRNPVAGMEGKYSIEPTDDKKTVMIVGGGVAGLECARIAAMRGHEVLVYELDSRLGGQIWLAACPPGREDIKTMVDWYKEVLERLKVKIALNRRVDVGLVKDLQPDVVIIATGARPVKPDIEGVDLHNVHFAWDFLKPDSNILPGDKCVVVGGGATGVETAIALAHFGSFSPDIAAFLNYFKILNDEKAWEITRKRRDVTIIEMLGRLGNNFGKSTRWTMLQDLERLEIQSHLNTTISNIMPNDDGTCKISCISGDETISLDKVDDVFLATSIEPVNDLHDDLKGVVKCKVIGDARKTGDLMASIKAGFKQGMKL